MHLEHCTYCGHKLDTSKTLYLFEAWCGKDGFDLIPVVSKSELGAKRRLLKHIRKFSSRTEPVIQQIFNRGETRDGVPSGFDAAYGVNNPMTLLKSYKDEPWF